MSALPERAEGWPGPGAYRFAGAVSGCAAGVSLAVAETLKALRTVQTSQNIWEDLPDDLLIEIFKRADLAQPQAVRQRCQVGLVCRKWNAALESGKFWKAITLDMNEFDSPEAVSAALQGCARRATQPDCTLRIVRSQPSKPSAAHDPGPEVAATAVACTPAVSAAAAGRPLHQQAEAVNAGTAMGPAAAASVSPLGTGAPAVPAEPAGCAKQRACQIHLCGGHDEVHPALMLTKFCHPGAVEALLADYLESQQGLQLWPLNVTVALPWRVHAQERLIDECSRLLYSITSPDLDPVISALSLLSLFK